LIIPTQRSSDSCSGHGSGGRAKISEQDKLIDFHDYTNYGTYVDRVADPAWARFFKQSVPATGGIIADVGCGGGIYTRAVTIVRPDIVIGVDFSSVSLASAAEYCGDLPVVRFLLSSATDIALREGSIDVVVERALIHHLDSLTANFAEIRRILKPRGLVWIQDRTIDDVLLPASQEHIRGYYLQYYPKLRAIEVNRRRHEKAVAGALREAGFVDVTTRKLIELRKSFQDLEALRDEILSRRGRSILHAVSDGELEELAALIGKSITHWPVHERDRWTVWTAVRPAS
jgi:ubiquinone/menaquinone biosynthesis C-methylase UbiE